jgi:hypothetical protein
VTRRILPLAAAALGVLALTACSQFGTKTEAQPSSAPAASAVASGSAKASAKASAKPSASAKASGSAGIPDICKLLTKAEVAQLTGEQTTLMTDDGSPAGSTSTKYCQWQLSQGQLTITISLEDREGFDVRNKESKPVPGVGTTAYSLAGHLYVWEDGKDIDVYVSSESSDQGNLSVARRVALQVLPRLKTAK